MPKLWNQTIETHREAVRDAILDSAESLAGTHGPMAVTMSQVAQAAGIGRATLYKYFPSVEAIFLAWHERRMAGFLDHLAAASRHAGDPERKLREVLQIHAAMLHEHHGDPLAAVMHQGAARDRQYAFLEEVLTEAARAGTIRDDVPARELAHYCVHAISAAADARSKATVERLVQVTVDGLKHPPGRA